MGFGVRIFRLWRLRTGVAVCAALAVLAALWSVDRISLFPPHLTPRSIEMATATTHIVVDTPKSTIIDLRQDTYNIESLTQRSILLGNIMANGPVRASIAQRAHLPVEALQIAAPLTARQPRAAAGSAAQKHTSDILKSTDQYRLSIQANPTVPVLDIYAQSPNAKSAEVIANAAVDSLRTYLSQLATAQDTPPDEQIRILQLGRARGEVINKGIEWQAAVVAFVIAFALSCATLIFIDRVRKGWRSAALAEQAAAGG
jgi:hypothetical protein